MVRHFVGLALLTLAGMFILALAMVAGCGVATLFCIGTEHTSSVEFVATQAGAPRFQRYETNEDGLDVVVDAETGVAYLVTSNGVAQLVESDGEPLTIAEVGE